VTTQKRKRQERQCIIHNKEKKGIRRLSESLFLLNVTLSVVWHTTGLQGGQSWVQGQNAESISKPRPQRRRDDGTACSVLVAFETSHTSNLVVLKSQDLQRVMQQKGSLQALQIIITHGFILSPSRLISFTPLFSPPPPFDPSPLRTTRPAATPQDRRG